MPLYVRGISFILQRMFFLGVIWSIAMFLLVWFKVPCVDPYIASMIYIICFCPVFVLLLLIQYVIEKRGKRVEWFIPFEKKFIPCLLFRVKKGEKKLDPILGTLL
jgi:hypothetical protein